MEILRRYRTDGPILIGKAKEKKTTAAKVVVKGLGSDRGRLYIASPASVKIVRLDSVEIGWGSMPVRHYL